MKKLIYLLFIVVIISGCKQEDTGAPQIYFKVSNPDSAIVGEQYEIPTPQNNKVVADDNVDGRAVEDNLKYEHNIPVSNVAGDIVFPSTIGNYYILYTVEDNAGNKTSKKLNVVVYNEAYIYSTMYRVVKSSNESISPDYNEYDNVFVRLEQDEHVNMRLIFPKLSNIEGLSVYGDLLPGDTTLIVDIPSQEVPIIVYNDSTNAPVDTFLYVVRNTTAGSSYFIDMVNYKIRLRYDINKYKITNQNNADYTTQSVPEFGIYWDEVNSDVCTEIYTKM